VQVVDLLKEAATQHASDMHMVPGMPPLFRIDGQLMPVANWPRFASDQIQQFVVTLLTDSQREKLGVEFCVDFSLNVDETRFRGNAFFQRAGLEVVFRLIPAKIPTPEDIMLPQVVTDLANLRSGLVLVTGTTGSGKTTTLACLVDLINERRRGNIITIEDPIEFVHANKNCIVSQREVGLHAPGFAPALRTVMRQDPDVVMIGEMRDLETISTAVSLAETGHLVLATLHSPDAAQAVDRVIDVFPATQQQQIRTQMAGVLRAVIAQTLVTRSRGRGRVAVREIMLVNGAISNLIRTGKSHEIYSAIEIGAREGMVSANRALAELMRKGLIDNQEVDAHNSKTNSPRQNQAMPGPSAAA
jgi:twitching motility protein PilT